ncbi:MAG: queuosine precursor transporter [Spirochaetales bacterium]|nr:queuosine precursor transporter [Spirochaetales bacterium]
MKPLYETEVSVKTITSMAIMLVGAYIAAQMLADITSNKIGILFGISIDLGTFIYPITFTLRDLIHKHLGKKAARTIVITAAVINICMAGYMYMTAYFPSDPTWVPAGDAGWTYHQAFIDIFASTPRIVVASIIAEVISELLDTEIYHWWVTKITARHQWARVLISNAISVPLDSIIFTLGAFAFTLEWPVVISIFVGNIIIKFIVTVASIPMIYLVPERKKQAH